MGERRAVDYAPVGMLALLALLAIVGGISGRAGDMLAALIAPQALDLSRDGLHGVEEPRPAGLGRQS